MQSLALDYYALDALDALAGAGSPSPVEDLPVARVDWLWDAPPLAAALMHVRCPMELEADLPDLALHLGQRSDNEAPEATKTRHSFARPTIKESWQLQAADQLLGPDVMEQLHLHSLAWLSENAVRIQESLSLQERLQMKEMDEQCAWMNDMAAANGSQADDCKLPPEELLPGFATQNQRTVGKMQVDAGFAGHAANTQMTAPAAACDSKRDKGALPPDGRMPGFAMGKQIAAIAANGTRQDDGQLEADERFAGHATSAQMTPAAACDSKQEDGRLPPDGLGFAMGKQMPAVAAHGTRQVDAQRQADAGIAGHATSAQMTAPAAADSKRDKGALPPDELMPGFAMGKQMAAFAAHRTRQDDVQLEADARFAGQMTAAAAACDSKRDKSALPPDGLVPRVAMGKQMAAFAANGTRQDDGQLEADERFAGHATSAQMTAPAAACDSKRDKGALPPDGLMPGFAMGKQMAAFAAHRTRQDDGQLEADARFAGQMTAAAAACDSKRDKSALPPDGLVPGVAMGKQMAAFAAHEKRREADARFAGHATSARMTDAVAACDSKRDKGALPPDGLMPGFARGKQTAAFAANGTRQDDGQLEAHERFAGHATSAQLTAPAAACDSKRDEGALPPDGLMPGFAMGKQMAAFAAHRTRQDDGQLEADARFAGQMTAAAAACDSKRDKSALPPDGLVPGVAMGKQMAAFAAHEKRRDDGQLEADARFAGHATSARVTDAVAACDSKRDKGALPPDGLMPGFAMGKQMAAFAAHGTRQDDGQLEADERFAGHATSAQMTAPAAACDSMRDEGALPPVGLMPGFAMGKQMAAFAAHRTRQDDGQLEADERFAGHATSAQMTAPAAACDSMRDEGALPPVGLMPGFAMGKQMAAFAAHRTRQDDGQLEADARFASHATRAEMTSPAAACDLNQDDPAPTLPPNTSPHQLHKLTGKVASQTEGLPEEEKEDISMLLSHRGDAPAQHSKENLSRVPEKMLSDVWQEGEGKVATLDMQKLGVDSLASIWSLEGLPRMPATSLSGPADPNAASVEGHLRFQCPPAIAKACLASCWRFGKEEVADLSVPDVAGAQLPGAADVFEDGLRFEAPLRADEGRDVLQLPAEPGPCLQWRHSWEEHCIQRPSWQPRRETWDATCRSVFQDQGLAAHFRLLCVPQEPPAAAAAAFADDSNRRAREEIFRYARSPQEAKLSQQLDTSASLAWLAYRDKLPMLEPPLAGVQEELPDMTELQRLLNMHEEREEKAGERGLDCDLYRLLYNLRVLVLLRQELKASGLLQALHCALALVAPCQAPMKLLGQTPLVKSALLTCHEVLRSALAGAGSEATRSLLKVKDLCDFVKCPGCPNFLVTAPGLRGLEAPRVEALKALRKKAIDKGQRLVVVFASQRLLDAIAVIIGADTSGKVARRAEVVAVAALTAPTRCEQLLQSCATALVHESALEFQAEAAAPAQQSSEIVAAWEVRRLLKQSLVVAYQSLAMETAQMLVHFRLEPHAEEAALATDQDRALEDVPAPSSVPGADPAMPEDRPTLMVGAHLLHAQDLLRELEAQGLRVLEREVLAASSPDLLLGPRSCCFLRSAHLLRGQEQDLCDRIQRSLLAFEEVLLLIVLESESAQDKRACEDLLGALRMQHSDRALRASSVHVRDLVQLLAKQIEATCAAGRGLGSDYKESEPEELPRLALRPGLNAALAERLLAERAERAEVEAPEVEAPVLAPVRTERTAHWAEGLGRAPGALVHQPAVRPGPSHRAEHLVQVRRPDPDSDQEVQTPQQKPAPAYRAEELLTPPDRIMAPTRMRSASAFHGQEPREEKQLQFPDWMEGEATPQLVAQLASHHSCPSQCEAQWPALLPQKRPFEDELSQALPNRPPDKAYNKHTWQISNENRHRSQFPAHPPGGLRGVQTLNRRTRTPGSLFGSICPGRDSGFESARWPANRGWMG
ncbi:unnamed protein product [Effrenium voratum]|nr:unnamed protein product [Effrenium voratum]